MAAAMATRRAREPMLIALPPRLTTSMSQDSLDLLPKTPGPHTPLPHTPMPYEFALGHELTLQHDKNGDSLTRLEFDTGYSMPVGAIGEKRSRESSQTSDDYECVKDVAWSEEEVEMLQNALFHPWRPVSTSYPPGDLPPTNVIDELANQVLSFAYRSSPRNASSEDDKCWTRTWDETRKKLFSLALDNSKFGQDSKERKMTRQDRKAAQSRPGLRRMDSMDFMDQEDEVTSGETTDETDSISRAIRLSTTLQNTAKLDSGSVGMSRSASEGSGSSRDRPKTRNVSTPQPSPTAPSISVIPASPEPPAPLRCKGSYRGPGAKPIRPSSLLQRGRSFTASDLAAEAEAEIKEIKATPLIATNPIVTSPVSERSSFILKPLTRLSDEPKPVESASEKTVLDRMKGPRLTRSQSSSALNDPPHPVRDTFMSHKPSTTDRSVLAMPLNIVDTANQPARNTSSWSDSEDDSAPVRAPAGKRLRGRGGSRMAKSRPRVLGAEALSFGGALGDGGLRSPFEEKVGMGF